MRSIVILLVVCGVLGLGPLLQPYKNEAQNQIKQLLKEKQHNFESLYHEIQILKQTQGQWDQDQACTYLRKEENLNLSPRQAYYQLKAIKSIDGCDYSDLQIPQPSRVIQDDFTDFYYNGLLGLELNQNTFCNKLDVFLGKDGAAKIRKNKSEDNYEEASQLYHFALECINFEKNQTLQQEIVAVISLPIQTALINLQEVFANTRSFVERENSVISTARFMSVFLELIPHLGQLNLVAQREFEDQLVQDSIINLLRESLKDDDIDSGVRYWVLNSLSQAYLKDLVIPAISSQINFQSKTVQIQVKFSDVFGNKAQPPTSIVGTLYQKDKVFQRDIVFQISNKLKDHAGFFELVQESIKNLGQYNLQLQTSNGKLNYKFDTSVQIGTKFKIQEFNFAIVQGKNAKPDFSNYVEETELYPRTLDANEHSFLHVIFKLVFEKGQTITPQQVAIRLAHPSYPTASFFVQAKYDGRREIYHGLVDFGEPEHILPVNGLYGVELLVGDVRLVENKRWKFAQIEVSFGISLKNGPVTETDYVIAGPIIHNFAPPMQEVPFIFVSFFLGVIVIAFVFYLATLQGIGVNTNRLPNEFTSQIIVYSFLALVLCIFGVLVLFWVVFNLIETLTILSVVLVPLFLVGNFALLSLK